MNYEMYQYFSFFLAIVYLMFASYTDFKRREVSDWLNYSFFIFAILFNLLLSFYFFDFVFVLNSLFGFICAFVVSYLMYRFGKWGGGDAKVLINLGLLFGLPVSMFINFTNIPFLLNLIFNIFVLGSFYGVLWLFYLFIRSLFIGKFEKGYFRILTFFMFFILFLVFSFLFFSFKFSFFFLLSVVFTMVFFMSLVYYLGRYVESYLMTKYVSVSFLVDGDWIDQKISLNNKSMSFLDFIKIKEGLVFRDISFLSKLFIYFKFGKNFSNYSDFVSYCEFKVLKDLESEVELEFSKFEVGVDILHLKPVDLLSKLNSIKLKDNVLYGRIMSYFKDRGFFIDRIFLCEKGCSVTSSVISFLRDSSYLKKIRVKDGVPFVPGIFLALIFTIFFNKSILFVVKMITFIR